MNEEIAYLELALEHWRTILSETLGKHKPVSKKEALEIVKQAHLDDEYTQYIYWTEEEGFSCFVCMDAYVEMLNNSPCDELCDRCSYCSFYTDHCKHLPCSNKNSPWHEYKKFIDTSENLLCGIDYDNYVLAVRGMIEYVEKILIPFS